MINNLISILTKKEKRKVIIIFRAALAVTVFNLWQTVIPWSDSVPTSPIQLQLVLTSSNTFQLISSFFTLASFGSNYSQCFLTCYFTCFNLFQLALTGFSSFQLAPTVPTCLTLSQLVLTCSNLFQLILTRIYPFRSILIGPSQFIPVTTGSNYSNLL